MLQDSVIYLPVRSRCYENIDFWNNSEYLHRNQANANNHIDSLQKFKFIWEQFSYLFSRWQYWKQTWLKMTLALTLFFDLLSWLEMQFAFKRDFIQTIIQIELTICNQFVIICLYQNLIFHSSCNLAFHKRIRTYLKTFNICKCLYLSLYTFMHLYVSVLYIF